MVECPHPRCTLPTEGYACLSHWWGLPRSIRNAVSQGGRDGQAWTDALEYWGVR